MKKVFFRALIFGASVILVSCKKNENGGNLSYRINPSNFSTSVATGSTTGITVSSTPTLTWTSGTMNISEIDFEAENENLEVEYELKNPASINLLSPSPILGSIDIPDGFYEEVELKIEIDQTTGTNVPLALAGHYTDANGIKTPVEFYLNEDFEISVESENITISSEDISAMINLRLDLLVSNVSSSDFSNASKTNGKIVVSSNSNTMIYNKVKSALNLMGDCDFEK